MSLDAFAGDDPDDDDQESGVRRIEIVDHPDEPIETADGAVVEAEPGQLLDVDPETAILLIDQQVATGADHDEEDPDVERDELTVRVIDDDGRQIADTDGTEHTLIEGSIHHLDATVAEPLIEDGIVTAVSDDPTERDGYDPDPWHTVRTLLQDRDPGTTTQAYNMAASVIGERFHIATIRESGAVYFYDAERGIYVHKGTTYLEELVNDRLDDLANQTRRREIINRVKGDHYVDAADFNPPAGKVNVRNGVLDLATKTLEPHSPAYHFTAQLEADWIADAADLDDDAVDWWVTALEDATDDPRERDKIEEFIGYCLEVWHHDREKNLFFVGPRLSGKSTIQEAIQELFGDPPTVTNLTPQQIADTQFDVASLWDAAINTVNDINATKIEDTGTLKRVFSGERLKLERKFEDAHFAEPKAKHLFTANWLPRLVGQDDAVYRRVLLVEFTKTLRDDQKDPDYKRRLKTDAVKAVILHRAVDALERLNDQDGFTNDRSPTATRRLWDSWRDGHKRFLYSQFEITGDEDDQVDRRAYWQAYREFASQRGFELKSNVAITKGLQYVPEVYASGSGDTYGGLRWADDAGEAGGGPDEAHQLGLGDTQATRKRQIKSWVEAFETPRDPAAVEAIVEHAADHDMDPDLVVDEIERMVMDGELIAPADGAVRNP